MKTRLLKRLRRKAKRNIEICVPFLSPEYGYYFFNKYLHRAYSPREKYDKHPWSETESTKYCETVDEVREEYKHVLWSETNRLLELYKAKKLKEEMLRRMRRIKRDLDK